MVGVCKMFHALRKDPSFPPASARHLASMDVAVEFSVRHFDDERIVNPDAREMLLQSLAYLMMKARFVRFFEKNQMALYDGLLPLLARQVLFGMVKFLVFDYAGEAILAHLPPEWAAAPQASALVSLTSGALAGVAAACVSQPADVVLSKVAQGSGGGSQAGQVRGPINQVNLLWGTAQSLWRQFGLSGLYLGIGSRCAWSGVIIAGQFFLYDLLKSSLHVAADDLRQFYDLLGAALQNG